MSEKLPPVPHREPMLDRITGFLTPAWAEWFRAAFVRMGGHTASTNAELTSSSAAGVQANLDAHIADASGAHAASAISNSAAGNLAATNVQSALNELQTDIDTRALDSSLSAHLADTTDAHAASAITNTPSGNLAATTVQAALNELQTDVDGRMTSTLADGKIFVGNASNVATAQTVTGDIAIDNAGAVSISSGVIVNADVNAAAAIAYSKLSLSGSIVNADVNASAAIAVSKLAAVTASRALVSDASGFVSPSLVTSTTLGFLDATSSVQTQIDAKTAKSTLTTKGDIYVATAASTPARLAVGSDTQVLTADSTQTAGVKWATPAAAPTADGTTILNTAGTWSVKDGGITQAKLASRATGSSVAAGGVATSSSTGTLTLGAGAETDVTNLSVSITTTGRPVFVGLISAGTTSNSYIGAAPSASVNWYFFRDSTKLTDALTNNNSTTVNTHAPPGTLYHVDFPAAGTYTYKLRYKNATNNGLICEVKLVAYEL
jgi:hypothetical protein